MIHYKILKQFNRQGAFTKKLVKYYKIEVFNEPINVKGISFKMNTIYTVPVGEVKNYESYVDPLDNPDYNYERAFNIYRKKLDLMSPKIIVKLRNKYGLSQRDLAALLGISHATLSEIENNKRVQSSNQDNLLRYLMNPEALSKLIKRRVKIIKLKHPAKVNINKLISIRNRILKDNDTNAENRPIMSWTSGAIPLSDNHFMTAELWQFGKGTKDINEDNVSDTLWNNIFGENY